MREIKFRSWNRDDNTIIKDVFDPSQNYGLRLETIIAAPSVVVMQFTGLKDKNGVTYCQDDIVLWNGKHYRLIKGTYMFELVGFNLASQDNPSDFFGENAYQFGEVVGNIFQHKHLLDESE